MREVITVTGKNWREEDKKISQTIQMRYQEICQQNPAMVITEAYLQAVTQLMQEEKLPLLTLPNGDIYLISDNKQYAPEKVSHSSNIIGKGA